MGGVEEAKRGSEEAWEEAKKYLRVGGDVTYAYLRLALRDLELAEPLIRDGYCRKQVRAEIDLLKHALKLAMVAFEWRVGAPGYSRKLRLWLSAVKESAIILVLQLRRL